MSWAFLDFFRLPAALSACLSRSTSCPGCRSGPCRHRRRHAANPNLGTMQAFPWVVRHQTGPHTHMTMMSNLRTLPDQFERLESLVSRADERNPAISAWSVGDQIEHICMAAGGFAVVLITGRGPSFAGAHRDQKHEVLVDGVIPRGVIKVPAAGEPKTGRSADELTAMLKKTWSRVEKAASVADDRTADHPLLGPLTRDEMLRFTEVHTDHHLRIIDEILGPVNTTPEPADGGQFGVRQGGRASVG